MGGSFALYYIWSIIVTHGAIIASTLAVATSLYGLQRQRRQAQRLEERLNAYQSIGLTVTGGNNPVIGVFGKSIVGCLVADRAIEVNETDERDAWYLKQVLVHAYSRSGFKGFTKLYLNDREYLESETTTIAAGQIGAGLKRLTKSYSEGKDFSRKANKSGRDQWAFAYDDRIGTGTDTGHFPDMVGNNGYSTTDTYEKLAVTYTEMLRSVHTMQLFNGVPKLRREMEGALVYDPRKDGTRTMADDGFVGTGTHRLNDMSTWEYSDNPALCAAELGMIRGLEIEWAQTVIAANWCDKMVAVPGNKMEKQFVLSLTYSYKDSFGELMQDIGTACNCAWLNFNNRWSLQAPVTEASVMTITEDDMVQEENYVSNAPLAEKRNTVTAVILDAEDGYSEREVPEHRDDAAITRDGKKLIETLNLRGVTQMNQAQRLCYMELQEQKLQERMVLKLGFKGLRLERNAIITIDSAIIGQPKLFRVKEIKFNTRDAATVIDCIEHDPAVYGAMPVSAYHTVSSTGVITRGAVKPKPVSFLTATSHRVGIDWKWGDLSVLLYDKIRLYTAPKGTMFSDDLEPAFIGNASEYLEPVPAGEERCGWVIVERDGEDSDRYPDDLVSSVCATGAALPQITAGPLGPGGFCPPPDTTPFGTTYESGDKVFRKDRNPFDDSAARGRLGVNLDVQFTLDTSKFTLSSGEITGAPGGIQQVTFKGSADRQPINTAKLGIFDPSGISDAREAIGFRTTGGKEGSQRVGRLTKEAADPLNPNRNIYEGIMTDSALMAMQNLMQVKSAVTFGTKASNSWRATGVSFPLPTSWTVQEDVNAGQFRVYSNGDVGLVLSSGGELTDYMEQNLRIVLYRRRDNQKIDLPGPDATMNQTKDETGNFYRWKPAAAKVTESTAFYTSAQANDVVDILLYDDDILSPIDLLRADSTVRCPGDVASSYLLVATRAEAGITHVELDIFQTRLIGQTRPQVPSAATLDLVTFVSGGLGLWSPRLPSFNPRTEQVWGSTAVANSSDTTRNAAGNPQFSFDAGDWATPQIVNADGDLDICYRYINKEAVTAADTPADSTTFPPTGWVDDPADLTSGTGFIYQSTGYRRGGQQTWTFTQPVRYEGADGISFFVRTGTLQFISTETDVSNVAAWVPAHQRSFVEFRRGDEVLLQFVQDFDMVTPGGTVRQRPTPEVVRGRTDELALLGSQYQNANPNTTPVDPDGISDNFLGACYRRGNTGAWTKVDISGTPASSVLRQTLGSAPAAGEIDERITYDAFTYGEAERCVFVTFLGNTACMNAIAIAPNHTAETRYTLTYLGKDGAQDWVMGQTAPVLRPSTGDAPTGTKSYTMTGNPAGVSIDAATGIITPTPTAVGEGTIIVTETIGGESTRDEIAYKVLARARPPRVNIELDVEDRRVVARRKP